MACIEQYPRAENLDGTWKGRQEGVSRSTQTNNEEVKAQLSNQKPSILGGHTKLQEVVSQFAASNSLRYQTWDLYQG